MSEQPQDDAVNLADPQQPLTIEALQAMMTARSNEKPKEYVPPPRTERQRTALEEEMEAGRQRVAFNEAQKASRPQMSAADRAHEVKINGNPVQTSTPVMRPTDGAGSDEMNAGKLKNGRPLNPG